MAPVYSCTVHYGDADPWLHVECEEMPHTVNISPEFWPLVADNEAHFQLIIRLADYF